MRRIFFFTAVILLASAAAPRANLLMETHGITTFAPYVNGVKKTDGLYPGYRGEFLAHVDFLREGNLFLTGLIGNMTIISRSDSSVFTLDRIRYTVAPGLRYERRTWIATGSFHHESIYAISKAEERSGAFWANSIRMGIGTKESYTLYMRERYDHPERGLLGAWDAQINAGVFLNGTGSIWTAKNHDYRYEFFGLVRFYSGKIGKWVQYIGYNQHFWISGNNSTQAKASFTVNMFRKGAGNYFGVVYTYVAYDTFLQNNEKRLGSLGLRIVF